jgi:protein arginine phosphatase
MILFVCAGNTCRSPLAEVIACARGINAISAGLYASPGMPASRGALCEAEKRGLSLRKHRARQVTQDLLEKVNAIYVMNDTLAETMVKLYPVSRDKTTVITPNIPDPWGGADEAYSVTAACLEEFIRSL